MLLHYPHMTVFKYLQEKKYAQLVSENEIMF